MNNVNAEGEILAPGNASAEQVLRLRTENNDIEEQTRTLQARHANNAAVLEVVNETAVWEITEEIDAPTLEDFTGNTDIIVDDCSPDDRDGKK